MMDREPNYTPEDVATWDDDEVVAEFLYLMSPSDHAEELEFEMVKGEAIRRGLVKEETK